MTAKHQTHIHPGGCSFFLACKDFGRIVQQFIPHLRFNYFFLKWRLANAHYFHSLGQDQSKVAQRAQTTLTECSLTCCVRARFPIGSQTMPGQRPSQPTPTSLGPGCVSILV